MTEILALANYDVFVGNCTESLSVFMSRYSQRKVVVLTDEHTHTFCLERIRPLLPVEMLEISIAISAFFVLDICYSLLK